MPSITVITICFNNLSDLQKTCASVDTQNVHPLEHWIIDGSTSTEIKEWLHNEPQPAYRKWVNERDAGIADAFNKGIRLASGEILHLLNSGDIYVNEKTLSIVSNIFDDNKQVQWVSGKLNVSRAGHWIEIGKPFEKSKLYRGMRSVSHPTMFLRKGIYNRNGLFNLNYKIAMDYDLICRIANEPYEFINCPLAIFDDTGVSSVNYLKSLKENIIVYESYFGFSFKCRLWQLRLKFLYLLLQTALGKWLFKLKKKMGLENA